jgi:hypothetical protein
VNDAPLGDLFSTNLSELPTFILIGAVKACCLKIYHHGGGSMYPTIPITTIQRCHPKRSTASAAQSESPPLYPTARAVLAATVHLDCNTYERLIVGAAALYTQGHRWLFIDLCHTTRIAQAGLFGLYCAHLIFQGEQPPDPAGGMRAIRQATERVQLDGKHPVMLINVPAHLAPLLQRAGFQGDWR